MYGVQGSFTNPYGIRSFRGEEPTGMFPFLNLMVQFYLRFIEDYIMVKEEKGSWFPKERKSYNVTGEVTI